MRSTTMQKALTAPKTAPVDQPDNDRQRRRRTRSACRDLQQVAGRHRREVHVRADREVDAGGQQHEGHADGDDAGERRLLDDVQRVLGLEEIRRLQTEDRRSTTMKMIAVACRSRKPVSRSRVDAGHAATPCSRNAAAGSARGRNRRAANSPTISPRLITRMRSHIAISSSISEEMKRTPAPLGGEPVDDRVDLVLGADVDAARRLVEDEDRRLRHQPLGEHDLLLVAARQALRRRPSIEPALMLSAAGHLASRMRACARAR